MNLATALVRTAQEHPARPALRVGTESLTYREFLTRAQAAAGFMRACGAKPGDRVALVAPNVPSFPIVFYGALLSGCVVVPMSPLLSRREVSYHLSDSGTRMVFADRSAASAVEEAAEKEGITAVIIGPGGLTEEQLASSVPMTEAIARDGSDTAVILYTSGTTGSPKGAELTHDNLSSNARTTVGTLLHSTPDDVIMGCLPMFHVFGLTCGLNSAVLSGACLAMLPRFEADKALELIEHARVTIFEGVPTMYAAMLHTPGTYDTSSLRTCVSGGSAMPVEVLRSFENAFEATILEGYGLSETSPVASFNHPDRGRRVGSIGVPVAGVRIRVVDSAGADVVVGDVGELVVQGENVMKGYWRRPDATAEAIPDGWFRTGDLARADGDGFLYIVDRKKQMIIRGGYNVYPREVEEVLYEHPAIAEAAVVGLKHRSLGEEVGAAVVLGRGHTAAVEELRAFARERLAAYKYPRHVWMVEELPKGPTGKILHREVFPPSGVIVD